MDNFTQKTVVQRPLITGNQGNNQKNTQGWLSVPILLLTLAGCTTTSDPLKDFDPLTPSQITTAPQPRALIGQSFSPEAVAKGKYLVELLGCASCHTDGALIGQPNMERRLAGSSVGIAFSNPLVEKNPGVVYPANLTPDPDTGLGRWNQQQIVNMIRTGVDRHGNQRLAVMPWMTYSKISNDDAQAIAAYLQALPPVYHQLPTAVDPGDPAEATYIHFGVYRSRQ